MKNILNLSATEAKKFFLDEKNYFTLELPQYYSFDAVLSDSEKLLRGKNVSGIKNGNLSPGDLENVDFKLFHNKKSRLEWRGFELIHPLLYVDLVNKICDKSNWRIIQKRFAEYASNSSIVCCSIPIVDTRKRNKILNWWEGFEQKSVSNALKYQYMGCTDIENCYPSIYTHSIPWAIHTKKWAKNNRDKGIGNKIDKCIQAMNYGQTNGIPQGSVLMDFIAEIVLGYADEHLSIELQNIDSDYYILRYRDDYRIFSNEKATIEQIIRKMALVLSKLNLRLKSGKTSITDDILARSIKSDKMFCLGHPIDKSLGVQKRLLSIYYFSKEFPNSGSVKKYLDELYNDCFKDMKARPNSYDQTISILVEIMRQNPETYPSCSRMLSVVLNFLSKNRRMEYIDAILQKFKDDPFSDYLEIWLQRLTIVENRQKKYECELCKKVYNKGNIWNSDWVNGGFEEKSIIKEDVVSNLSPIIMPEEIQGFDDYTGQ